MGGSPLLGGCEDSRLPLCPETQGRKAFKAEDTLSAQHPQTELHPLARYSCALSHSVEYSVLGTVRGL